MRVTPGPTTTGSITGGTLDSRLQKFIDSKGYTAGHQDVSPAAAGNRVGERLVNAAGSGRIVVVIGAHLSSSVSQTINFEAPVTPAAAALLTGAAEIAKRTGQAAPVAGTGSYENSLGGSIVANPSPSMRILANQYQFVPLGYVLNADSSCDAEFTGGGVGDLDDFFWEWYEE